jgi:hypothetical protein
MKIFLFAFVCMLLPAQALFAQDLAAQQAQAQQVASNNGAARPAEIASQLAEAFGAQKNTDALLAKAVQLTDANPSEAAAIAAAAAVFAPSSAPLIARTIAALSSVQSQSGGGYKSTVEDFDPAAQIAAAVAAVAPASAAAIAAAVAAAAPASTAAIQSAVSQAAPGQASAIAAALSPGASGNPPAGVGLPSFNQFNSVNPANFSGGQATPTPTPPRPNSPSN